MIKDRLQRSKLQKLLELLHKGMKMEGESGDYDTGKLDQLAEEWQDRHLKIIYPKETDKLVYRQASGRVRKPVVKAIKDSDAEDASETAPEEDIITESYDFSQGTPLDRKSQRYHDMCMLKNKKLSMRKQNEGETQDFTEQILQYIQKIRVHKMADGDTSSRSRSAAKEEEESDSYLKADEISNYSQESEQLISLDGDPQDAFDLPL